MDRIKVPSRLVRYGIVLTHTIRMALKDVEQKLEAMDEASTRHQGKKAKPRAKRAKAAR